MLFNSFVFIFVFLPVTFIAYFGLNRLGQNQAAKGVLVLASLYFYAFFNWSYLPVILSSIAVNYLVCNRLSKLQFETTQKKRYRQLLFWIGILFNVGMLGYFKYTDFFLENVNALFGSSFLLKNILLPLGISFFTFQQVAFVVDCYKGKCKLPKFLDYANFVTFFPQLIAGPIVLPEEMLPQFENKENLKPNYRNMLDGLFIFSLGLVKKVLIADSIAVFANAGFSIETTGLTMAEAWLTSLAYTFQLYFDFSGYCDMAIGLGKIFNIHLPQNFNAPYRATNFQDFWKRWHMTLNRFLTQYVYIPLGGSRRNEARVLLNVMIVFFISGFWHGAGWTFIIWGISHGLGVVSARSWRRNGFSMPGWLGMFITFVCVNILWVLFRADNLQRAWLIIRSMFDNTNLALTSAFKSHLPSILPNKVNMIIFFVAVLLAFIGPTAYKLSQDYKNTLVRQTLTVVCFVASIFFLSRIVTFLYFNF